jgi:hypothetical protein
MDKMASTERYYKEKNRGSKIASTYSVGRKEMLSAEKETVTTRRHLAN